MLIDVPLDQITVGERIRKGVGHLGSLQTSVQRIGLLHPLVLNSRRELIAGFRRLQVVKNLEWKTVPCLILDRMDDVLTAVKAELAENVCREDMTPTEIVAAGRMIEEMEKERAKERVGGRPKKGAETSGKLPEVSETGQTRDKVGAAFGISGKTYEKAKQVVEAAEEDPEGFGDLPEKMDQGSIDAAYKELKQRKEQATLPGIGEDDKDEGDYLAEEDEDQDEDQDEGELEEEDETAAGADGGKFLPPPMILLDHDPATAAKQILTSYGKEFALELVANLTQHGG